MAAPEALGYQLGNVGFGNIVHRDILHTLVSQHTCEHVCGVLSVAVHGRVGDHDRLVLRLVGAPLLVLLQQQAIAPDTRGVDMLMPDLKIFAGLIAAANDA